MLATVTALVMVRLESSEDGADTASVSLTERFVEIMEAEHRELGLGDPGLGKKVRKLVSALARRVDLWREAVAAAIFQGPRPRASAPTEARRTMSPRCEICGLAFRRLRSQRSRKDGCDERRFRAPAQDRPDPRRRPARSGRLGDGAAVRLPSVSGWTALAGLRRMPCSNGKAPSSRRTGECKHRWSKRAS